MKILLVCESTEGTDGWSRYSKNTCDALRANGHIVLTHNVALPLSFMTRPQKSLLLGRTLAARMRKEQIDVLHFAVEPYALATLFLPKDLLQKTVLTIHGNYGVRLFRFWMTRIFAPRLFARINRFITVSTYTRNVVEAELKRIGAAGLAERFSQRATVIPNGIPLPNAQKRSDQNDTKQILHVGGVKGGKGVLEALKACAHYKKSYKTPFHLHIIGRANGDAYQAEVESVIQENNLNDSVTLHGRISDEKLNEHYNSADLLLLPSATTETTFEGFGLVYIEANAHGIPVIGPQSSGAAEAISDGVSGYQIDPKNPEQIAEWMHWILDRGKIDPKKCREWAEKHSIEKNVEAVEGVYSLVQEIATSTS